MGLLVPCLCAAPSVSRCHTGLRVSDVSFKLQGTGPYCWGSVVFLIRTVGQRKNYLRPRGSGARVRAG